MEDFCQFLVRGDGVLPNGSVLINYNINKQSTLGTTAHNHEHYELMTHRSVC